MSEPAKMTRRETIRILREIAKEHPLTDKQREAILSAIHSVYSHAAMVARGFCGD
jgi:predicted DNA binding protein